MAIINSPELYPSIIAGHEAGIFLCLIYLELLLKSDGQFILRIEIEWPLFLRTMEALIASAIILLRRGLYLIQRRERLSILMAIATEAGAFDHLLHGA